MSWTLADLSPLICGRVQPAELILTKQKAAFSEGTKKFRLRHFSYNGHKVPEDVKVCFLVARRQTKSHFTNIPKQWPTRCLNANKCVFIFYVFRVDQRQPLRAGVMCRWKRNETLCCCSVNLCVKKKKRETDRTCLECAVTYELKRERGFSKSQPLLEGATACNTKTGCVIESSSFFVKKNKKQTNKKKNNAVHPLSFILCPFISQ